MSVELSELTPLRIDELSASALPHHVPSAQKPPTDSLRCRILASVMFVIAVFVFLASSHVATRLTSSADAMLPSTTSIGAAWSADWDPYSNTDPRDLGFKNICRPKSSRPGAIFDRITQGKRIPLPTNSWCENFFLGYTNHHDYNRVFTSPYIVDTAGPIYGLRMHPPHIEANTHIVMTTFNPQDGVTLGAAQPMKEQHHIVPYTSLARLSIVMEWEADVDFNCSMRSAVVRGQPYLTMEYTNATPQVIFERGMLSSSIDNTDASLRCADQANGTFEVNDVRRELLLHMAENDHTYILFFSAPVSLTCLNYMPPKPDLSKLPPGVLPTPPPGGFPTPTLRLRASGPADLVIRAALVNNCTTGINPQNCVNGQPTNQSALLQLLRTHAEVFPTGESDIMFTFPSDHTADEVLDLEFEWWPMTFQQWHENKRYGYTNRAPPELSIPRVELLMYALPHHQERLHSKVGSSNAVLDVGCYPTLHGRVCPVTGATWAMREDLHTVDFTSKNPIRAEMMSSIQESLRKDLLYTLPTNYLHGIGDTYFSGKMLAKLARILIIAEEVGWKETALFERALNHLRDAVSVWYNGQALSPLVFDDEWGGVVGCGCDYNGSTCVNRYPDCPALDDAGQNYGSGYYNDHHFHYGYHIYAAAVLARFDKNWLRQYFDHVLVLIRDISNPAKKDHYFPTFRHKDWYLGSSWASGIVTLGGLPYPNGRNQESSAESIAAYESVALFGRSAANAFKGSEIEEDKSNYDTALRVHEMGRLLLSTEIRTAQVYWHVQSPGAEGVARIYPPQYEPKVVGMLWSFLAEAQTWFGNQQWKAYGIQLLPFTVASENRDSVSWVQEMLPAFNATCYNDASCMSEGWSILIYCCQATIGDWMGAWRNVEQLPDSVYDSAGGNGHSKSNTLWWIATRPDLPGKL